MPELLDGAGLAAHLDRYRAGLFRMEALPEYAVDDDGDDFRRWVTGEAEPTWARVDPWLDMLRRDTAAGKRNTRVRVLSERLTDYERYSCSWGYVHTSAAGEDIRILRRGEHDVPPTAALGDWWLVDDSEVVVMHYDEHGAFLGAEPVTDPKAVAVYLDVRDTAWTAAEPFPRWWARHPELHQRKAADVIFRREGTHP